MSETIQTKNDRNIIYIIYIEKDSERVREETKKFIARPFGRQRFSNNVHSFLSTVDPRERYTTHSERKRDSECCASYHYIVFTIDQKRL